MSFPLLCFPRVPRKIVFELFEPVDLIEFSLVSKSSKTSIRNCAIRAGILNYHPRSLSLSKDSGTYLVFDFNSQEALEPEEERRIKDGRFQRWTKPSEANKILCIPQNFDEDILSVFRYLQELFIIDGYNYSVTGFTRQFIQNTMMKIPKTVKSLTIGDLGEDEDVVHTVLDHCDVTSSVMIHSKVTRLHEKMKNLDHLMIRSLSDVSATDLTTLNCKIFHLQLTFNPSNDLLNTIIRHWKENKTDVKSFRITRIRGERDPDLRMILEGLDAKPFSYLRRSEKCEIGSDTINCTRYWDIERNCDGMLASFGFKKSYFEFIVWTERFPTKPFDY